MRVGKKLMSVKPCMLGELQTMVVQKHMYQISNRNIISCMFSIERWHWMQPLISARILLSCGIIRIVFPELSCQIMHLSAFGKQRLHMLDEVIFGPVCLTCFYKEQLGLDFPSWFLKGELTKYLLLEVVFT